MYVDIELPLIPVLASMEEYGVFIDVSRLDELEPFYNQEASKAYDATMEVIQQQKPLPEDKQLNLNSPVQVSWLLFEHLQLEPPRVNGKVPITNEGFISTDRKTVLEAMPSHPVLDALLDYRTYIKLLQFVTQYRNLLNPRTHRLHCSFNQVNTQSDRLSSSGPNLQQVPSRLDNAKKLRTPFISTPVKYTKDGKKRVIIKAIGE
jgi:DNA polymerase I